MKTPLSSLLLKSIYKHYSRPCLNYVSYSNLFESIQHYSKIFKTNKFQPFDRVVIQSNTKSVDQVALMVATWEARGVIVCLPQNCQDSIVSKVKPKLILKENQIILNDSKVYSPKPIDENDPALILFTSGSTAEPKGVVLSHRNIVSNIESIQNLNKDYITEKDRSFSILPWFHCYGLVCELLFLLSKGANVRLPTNSKNPIPEIKFHRPTLLFTVPKMLERIYKSRWNKPYMSPLLKFYLFGDRLRMMSVGGSYCHPLYLDHFEQRFGIPIYQGFGMTETSPMISLNSPSQNLKGSVGQLLENVEIKFDRQGQVFTRSPSVMLGYLDYIDENNIIHTKNILENGWLPTGDNGFLKDDYLFINGRIKNEYKLSNGKYINPLHLESLILQSPLIHQAIIFPSPGNNHNICIVYVESTKTDILKEIKKYLGTVEKYEIPKECYFFKEPCTLENGLLSLKLEPKRQEIIRQWKNLIFVNKKHNESS